MELKLSVSEYKELVRESVAPFYEQNDVAHRIEHADDVCEAALVIAEKIDCHMKPKMIIAAAYAHDLFSRNDKETRKNHHQEAHDFVLRGDVAWLSIFTDGELTKIANACREHRASWKGTYSGPLSVIIACADRGMPDLDKYLYRTYQYGVNVLKYGPREAIIRSVYHVHWKFGTNGKARVPPLWETYFETELQSMRRTLDILAHGLTEERGVRCIPRNGENDHFDMDIALIKRRINDGLDLTTLLLNYYCVINMDGKFNNVILTHWLPYVQSVDSTHTLEAPLCG